MDVMLLGLLFLPNGATPQASRLGVTYLRYYLPSQQHWLPRCLLTLHPTFPPGGELTCRSPAGLLVWRTVTLTRGYGRRQTHHTRPPPPPDFNRHARRHGT